MAIIQYVVFCPVYTKQVVGWLFFLGSFGSFKQRPAKQAELTWFDGVQKIINKKIK